VDLEEELQDRPEVRLGRIIDDLDPFGVIAVVAISRVLHLAAGIADAGADDAGLLADQVLHSPETAAGKDCTLFSHQISSTCSR
jgi:hypothetical protein